MYKENLALNKLQWLICHKTQPIAQLAGAVEYTVSLQRGKTPSNKCPRYDTKQSNGEFPVMSEFWRMWSIPSLSSSSGPLWPGVVAPDRVLSMGQIGPVEWVLYKSLTAHWIIQKKDHLYNKPLLRFNCIIHLETKW